MKRANKEKSSHDRKVGEIARKLKNQGYSVKADIGRYDKPSTIGKDKKRPDIEATRSGHRRIIEVETPKSLKSDKDQIKTFIRHATHKKGTSFDIVVTKPRKTKK